MDDGDEAGTEENFPEDFVKLVRTGAIVGAVAISALGLVACGSDNNSTGGSSTSSVASSASCDGKAALAAAGSSAQKNAMDSFTKAYIAACQNKSKSVNVAYTASGSGDGRNQFIAGQVDFAGSDSAIKEDQAAKAKSDRCGGNDTWNIPMVFGPVGLAYNIDGVDKLTLTGEVAAKIFNGTIKTWNDPAIAQINSGVNLPSQPIAVFFRSDSSGTTDNFQQYLAASSKGAWDAALKGSDFKGATGSGAKGSAGVAQGVAGTPFSITYVEKSYADQNKLKTALIDSGSGPVAMTTDTAAEAIKNVKFKTEGSNDLALDLKSTYASNTPNTYPLILATYEIVCSKGYPADVATGVKSFLTSAANEGQVGLDKQGYVPLPDSFKTKVLASIAAIS